MLRIALAALVLGAPPVAAQPLYKGWWVVLESAPLEPYERQARDAQRIAAKARACGATTFNDLSGKFKGFAPGVNAFVVSSAFATREEAERKLATIRPCFPDAYLKQGEHLGE